MKSSSLKSCVLQFFMTKGLNTELKLVLQLARMKMVSVSSSYTPCGVFFVSCNICFRWVFSYQLRQQVCCVLCSVDCVLLCALCFSENLAINLFALGATHFQHFAFDTISKCFSIEGVVVSIV